MSPSRSVGSGGSAESLWSREELLVLIEWDQDALYAAAWISLPKLRLKTQISSFGCLNTLKMVFRDGLYRIVELNVQVKDWQIKWQFNFFFQSKERAQKVFTKRKMSPFTLTLNLNHNLNLNPPLKTGS